jgi:hypothetical protein
MWTDGRKDMTKLTVACRSYANAPKDEKIPKYINSQKIHISISDLFHSHNSKQHVSACIAVILRAIHLYNIQITNVANHVTVIA